MLNIIINSDPKYSIDTLTLQAAAAEVIQQFKVPGNIEIGISIVSDKKMHEVNREYRGIDSTTNILSFALEDQSTIQALQRVPKMGFVKSPDKMLRLGDILISHPQVEKDAALEGVSVEDELIFLVQHGTRHLLGVHH